MSYKHHALAGEEQLALVYVALIIIIILIVFGNMLILFSYICIRLTLS